MMLTRKTKPSDWIEPMPAKQFHRIEKAFRKHGGVFVMGEEADIILNMQGAEAVTLNENTILFRKKPSRSAVYEELIHTYQFKSGKCDGSRMSRLFNEIEAKKKLLKYAEAYELTGREIHITSRMLASCEEEMEKLRKEQRI